LTDSSTLCKLGSLTRRVPPAALLVAWLLIATVAQGAGALAAESSAGPPGQRLWSARYNGPGDESDYGYALGVSPTGSVVFVTGRSFGSVTREDFATVAHDTVNGSELWVSRYDGPGHAYDGANDLGVHPDGSLVFGTGPSGGGTSDNYATVSYDAATGAERWVARYDGPVGNDFAVALEVSPNGSTVFVTGYSVRGAPYDYATVSYDAATGTQLWVARYDGPVSGSDVATDLGVSPDGSMVFVTGLSRGEISEDSATVAYDAATGAELWVSRYDGPGSGTDVGSAIGVGPDGSTVFVTGQSGGGVNDQYATVAYDAATGAELWVSRYDGPGSSADFPMALGVSPNGSSVFVTGGSTGNGTNHDYATVAYDAADGTQLWVARLGGMGVDSADALVVSPDGSTVFVTGSAQRVGNYEYATAAYDAATGAKLWATLAHGTGEFDFAYDLGVSPDGSAVFVTGSHQVRADVTTDYGTVAYST
jgi:outer membrane protein assembly factor BamB